MNIPTLKASLFALVAITSFAIGIHPLQAEEIIVASTNVAAENMVDPPCTMEKKAVEEAKKYDKMASEALEESDRALMDIRNSLSKLLELVINANSVEELKKIQKQIDDLEKKEEEEAATNKLLSDYYLKTTADLINAQLALDACLHPKSGGIALDGGTDVPDITSVITE